MSTTHPALRPPRDRHVTATRPPHATAMRPPHAVSAGALWFGIAYSLYRYIPLPTVTYRYLPLPGALWFGIAYSLYAFLRAEHAMCTSRRLLAGWQLTDPAARRALEARVVLWPRFMAFLLTYFVSVVPAAVYNSLHLEQVCSHGGSHAFTDVPAAVTARGAGRGSRIAE